MEIFLLIVILIVTVGAKLWTLPKVRGIVGEWQVRFRLGKTIPNQYYVVNDYQVKLENGSMQIDHMVINQYGVFVIETKNYSGRIYGNESQTKWTQVLAYGKVKNILYNPIMQNGMHIKHLSTILNRTGIYRNMVVFVRNNTYQISSEKLVSLSQIKSVINAPFTNTLLTSEEITALYQALMDYRESNAISNDEHVQNIETLQSNIENHICPRCGNQLVLRNGKHGEFWGCSQYPKCKFIKKM